MQVAEVCEQHRVAVFAVDVVVQEVCDRVADRPRDGLEGAAAWRESSASLYSPPLLAIEACSLPALLSAFAAQVLKDTALLLQLLGQVDALVLFLLAVRVDQLTVFLHHLLQPSSPIFRQEEVQCALVKALLQLFGYDPKVDCNLVEC